MAVPETPYRMKGRVVLRRIGEQALLVPVSGDAAGSKVYPANETAEAIWECLSAGGTPADAAKRLAEGFDVPEREALADCEACARALVEEGLLEVAGEE